MTVNVDGEKYEGSGASKKMAKHACARSALTKLYHMSFTPHMQGNKIHSVLAYLRYLIRNRKIGRYGKCTKYLSYFRPIRRFFKHIVGRRPEKRRNSTR